MPFLPAEIYYALAHALPWRRDPRTDVSQLCCVSSSMRAASLAGQSSSTVSSSDKLLPARVASFFDKLLDKDSNIRGLARFAGHNFAAGMQFPLNFATERFSFDFLYREQLSSGNEARE